MPRRKVDPTEYCNYEESLFPHRGVTCETGVLLGVVIPAFAGMTWVLEGIRH